MSVIGVTSKMQFLHFVILLLMVEQLRSDKIPYLKMVESFDALKVLRGLYEINNSSVCGEHVAEYLSGLKSDKYWTSVMFDSTAKMQNGILRGNVQNFGNFDECIQVVHPENKFTGKHCTLRINLASDAYNESDIFQLYLKSDEDKNAIHKIWTVKHGMCLPSTCSATNISKGLNFILNKNISSIFVVEVNEDDCWTNTPRKIEDTGWISIGIILTVGSVIIISTILDLYQQFISTNKSHQLLTSFSIYTNGQNLFKINEDSEQLKALHGIRVLSMCWVVLYHTAGSVWLDGPPINLFDSIQTYRDFNHVVIVNGFTSVDTFLFMSGLLNFIGFFRDIRKKGYYDVPLGYIHRYIRLTPSYAFMILISANIFIYTGYGPLWNTINKLDVQNCQKYWWSGLLYIQNFVNPISNCLGQSWYLSVDMQMHWLSPLILYPVYFWQKYAVLPIGIAILSAILVNFTLAYINGLGASYFTTNNRKLQWEVDYVQFYMRASPYVIGIALGYVITQIQDRKISFKLNKYLIVVGWLAATGLCLYSLYGIVPFNQNEYSVLEKASFLALHRVAWSIGLGWIIFACMQGYAGSVNVFLSWDIFQPLSRLTYSVYLIHLNVQHYRLGNLRTNTYAGDAEMIYTFLGDLILAYLLAIPFTLIFEMPFNNIDRFLFRGMKILPIPLPKPIKITEKELNGINLNAKEMEENTVKNPERQPDVPDVKL